jgi:hypothetical protein
VLRKAPTASAVARLRLDTLAALKRPGEGGRAIGQAKAEQLHALQNEQPRLMDQWRTLLHA